jgi:hypothetical protein
MDAAGSLDPRLLDLALALLALEGAGLIGWRFATGRGPAPRALIANLLAGAFLLLAGREILTGAGPLWIAAALTAAFVAHGLDLAARWERRAKPRTDPSAAVSQAPGR